jgi:CheY-like chemotaxis protein
MHNPPFVLIVDDEESFREIISTRLRNAGFATETAKNEREALEKAEQYMPDLILMDIYMPPGTNGTEVALALKQNSKTKDIKISFLSSMKDPWPGITGENKQVSRDIGMEDYLDKTKDLEIIDTKVKEILHIS